MRSITIREAFSAAPPRRRAVVCIQEAKGTYMVAAEWFTWLNIARQPMLSFSMRRDAERKLEAGAALVLCFPPEADVAAYARGVSVRGTENEKLPKGIAVAREGELLLPQGSEVALRCTLAHAYNYPFKKVRIHNCNLEEALGTEQEV